MKQLQPRGVAAGEGRPSHEGRGLKHMLEKSGKFDGHVAPHTRGVD